MRKLYFLTLTSLIISLIAHAQQIPAVKLSSIDGTFFNTNQFNAEKNIPVVLSFWATWCIPCINELSGIHDKYDDWKKGTAFEFYAISVDDSRTSKKVKPLVNGKNWDFRILLDTNQDLKRALNLTNIPYTLVIKNGKIIYRHAGYVVGDEDELFKVLKENQ